MTSSGEEWLIVLTTDHGGEGTSHDSYANLETRKIPFLAASNSPRMDIGQKPIDDPGSHMDVLPTIMHFLGGPDAVPLG